ncbi:MAG: signal peptidase I [Victivallales bacterium]|nr:signal peptidase I [Victivallales bacterium]
MPISESVQNFFFPRLNRWFFIRLSCLAAATFLFCRFVITPAWTNGASMLPTYQNHQFLPVLRCRYWFSSPKPGDVVAVRYIGQQMFLKRVVAIAGQTVAFHNGVLFIDGNECEEPWAHLTPCDWELAPRVVPPGEVYIIGDNRAMPISEHYFGHVNARRIIGTPLW